MAEHSISLGPELWGEDSIFSHIWTPLGDQTLGNDYSSLIVYPRHDTWDYLRMLVKLLPLGYPWRFPIGEPSDYGC